MATDSEYVIQLSSEIIQELLFICNEFGSELKKRKFKFFYKFRTKRKIANLISKVLDDKHFRCDAELIRKLGDVIIAYRYLLNASVVTNNQISCKFTYNKKLKKYQFIYINKKRNEIYFIYASGEIGNNVIAVYKRANNSIDPLNSKIETNNYSLYISDETCTRTTDSAKQMTKVAYTYIKSTLEYMLYLILEATMGNKDVLAMKVGELQDEEESIEVFN